MPNHHLPNIKMHTMKKITLLLLAAFALISCSSDSDSQPEVHYEVIPITRCNMPYMMTSGETYEFEMIYRMPTTCHTYKGIFFEGDGNVKKVAIQTVVYQRPDCQPIDYTTNIQPAPEPQVSNYQFKAAAPPGTVYTFKIWTGKNQDGEDTFYDVNVPVTN